MTNFSHGRQAEDTAAQYWRAAKYDILEQNWRTKWCEIDIVARKKNVIYFTEVKYRHSDSQGTGLEYITPKKLKQMQFAAEFWIAAHDSAEGYCLSAIEVSGAHFIITNFIEQL